MTQFLFPLLLFCGIGVVSADTVHVTVGDTGCAGRQIGVIESWKKIPGVVSVTVLPRQPGDQVAQRVFVIDSKAASPSADSLREALGRRAKHYPILRYVSEPQPVETRQKTELSGTTASNLPARFLTPQPPHHSPTRISLAYRTMVPIMPP